MHAENITELVNSRQRLAQKSYKQSLKQFLSMFSGRTVNQCLEGVIPSLRNRLILPLSRYDRFD